MSRVLKLNQSYEPLEIIDWKEAIKLTFLGKAEVIREYDDKVLRTSKMVFNMPSVIRLNNKFERPRRRINYNKKNIWIRDRYRCQYCSEKFSDKDLTLDHVVPRAQGGKTCFENIVACCKECNDKKKNRTPVQANMKLKRIPIKPDWMPGSLVSLSPDSIPESWKDFCFISDE